METSCEVHSGRTKEYYCKECKIAVCSDCVVIGSHNGHHVSFMEVCRIHSGRVKEYYCRDCKFAVCSHCVVIGLHRGHQATSYVGEISLRSLTCNETSDIKDDFLLLPSEERIKTLIEIKDESDHDCELTEVSVPVGSVICNRYDTDHNAEFATWERVRNQQLTPTRPAQNIEQEDNYDGNSKEKRHERNKTKKKKSVKKTTPTVDKGYKRSSIEGQRKGSRQSGGTRKKKDVMSKKVDQSPVTHLKMKKVRLKAKKVPQKVTIKRVSSRKNVPGSSSSCKTSAINVSTSRKTRSGKIISVETVAEPTDNSDTDEPARKKILRETHRNTRKCAEVATSKDSNSGQKERTTQKKNNFLLEKIVSHKLKNVSVVLERRIDSQQPLYDKSEKHVRKRLHRNSAAKDTSGLYECTRKQLTKYTEHLTNEKERSEKTLVAETQKQRAQEDSVDESIGFVLTCEEGSTTEYIQSDPDSAAECDNNVSVIGEYHSVQGSTSLLNRRKSKAKVRIKSQLKLQAINQGPTKVTANCVNSSESSKDCVEVNKVSSSKLLSIGCQEDIEMETTGMKTNIIANKHSAAIPDLSNFVGKLSEDPLVFSPPNGINESSVKKVVESNLKTNGKAIKERKQLDTGEVRDEEIQILNKDKETLDKSQHVLEEDTVKKGAKIDKTATSKSLTLENDGQKTIDDTVYNEHTNHENTKEIAEITEATNTKGGLNDMSKYDEQTVNVMDSANTVDTHTQRSDGFSNKNTKPIYKTTEQNKDDIIVKDMNKLLKSGKNITKEYDLIDISYDNESIAAAITINDQMEKSDYYTNHPSQNNLESVSSETILLNTPDSIESFTFVCVICGKDAEILKFKGIFVCMACKSFLRRQLVDDDKDSYICIAKEEMSLDKCDIDSRGQFKCRKCRYAKAVSSGLITVDKRKLNKELGPVPCEICENRTKEKHFGVKCCGSCLKFYKRSRKLKKKYICVTLYYGDETIKKEQLVSCCVDPDTGKFRCRYCRLARCFAKGMPDFFLCDKNSLYKRRTKMKHRMAAEHTSKKIKDSKRATTNQNEKEIEHLCLTNTQPNHEQITCTIPTFVPSKNEFKEAKLKMDKELLLEKLNNMDDHIDDENDLNVENKYKCNLEDNNCENVRSSEKEENHEATCTQNLSDRTHEYVCVVCGRPAPKIRYGVHACEVCRIFFLKSLKKFGKYSCIAGQNGSQSTVDKCDVDPKTFKFKCKKCRYAKCIAQGMKKQIKGNRPLQTVDTSEPEETKCPRCDKEFLTKAALKSHMKHAHKDGYPCKVCSQMLQSAMDLDNHLLTHHPDRKQYICDFDGCDKAYTAKQGLVDHQLIHRGERPYVCATCGKAFVRNCDFKKHEIIHTNRRPFKCSKCSMSFNRKTVLQRHVRFVHIKTKRTIHDVHLCAVCGKTCSSISKLNGHMQEHGEMKYHCQICPKSYALKACFMAHLKSHQIGYQDLMKRRKETRRKQEAKRRLEQKKFGPKTQKEAAKEKNGRKKPFNLQGQKGIKENLQQKVTVIGISQLPSIQSILQSDNVFADQIVTDNLNIPIDQNIQELNDIQNCQLIQKNNEVPSDENVTDNPDLPSGEGVAEYYIYHYDPNDQNFTDDIIPSSNEYLINYDATDYSDVINNPIENEENITESHNELSQEMITGNHYVLDNKNFTEYRDISSIQNLTGDQDECRVIIINHGKDGSITSPDISSDDTVLRNLIITALQNEAHSDNVESNYFEASDESIIDANVANNLIITNYPDVCSEEIDPDLNLINPIDQHLSSDEYVENQTIQDSSNVVNSDHASNGESLLSNLIVESYQSSPNGESALGTEIVQSDDDIIRYGETSNSIILDNLIATSDEIVADDENLGSTESVISYTVPQNFNLVDYCNLPSNENVIEYHDVLNDGNVIDYGDVPDDENVISYVDATNNENVIGYADVPDDENVINYGDVPNNENVINYGDVPNIENVINYADVPNDENGINYADVPNDGNTINYVDAPSEENVILDYSALPSNETDDLLNGDNVVYYSVPYLESVSNYLNTPTVDSTSYNGDTPSDDTSINFTLPNIESIMAGYHEPSDDATTHYLDVPKDSTIRELLLKKSVKRNLEKTFNAIVAQNEAPITQQNTSSVVTQEPNIAEKNCLEEIFKEKCTLAQKKKASEFFSSIDEEGEKEQFALLDFEQVFEIIK